jgi:hypothetical protein
MTLPIAVALSSNALRDEWQPTHRQLSDAEERGELRIRIHRACKALQVAESLDAVESNEDAPDAGLVFRWVALNALYGSWDEGKGMPTSDRTAVDRFTSDLCRIDAEGRMQATLQAIAEPAKELLASPFLHTHFWKDPEWEHVRPKRRNAAKFRDELRENRPSAGLYSVLMAIYFLRCQIIHGGATIGSRMNRVTVEPAAEILCVIAGQAVAIVIDHWSEMNFGPLCYPPVREPESDRA